MTTRDHLIYRMQEHYSFHRDFLALLDSMLHESTNAALCQTLQRQHESIKGELEPLERALNVLGAQYKMERNPLVPAFKEITARFKHQMNPSREQLDVHMLLQMLDVSHLSISDYRADIELARALGEQDVVTLMQENLQRRTKGMEELETLAPKLIQDVGGKETKQEAA